MGNGDYGGNETRDRRLMEGDPVIRWQTLRDLADQPADRWQERFTHLSFPSHRDYTVLRGLDYLRTRREIGDARLEDPLALLASRRRPNGRWPVEKRIAGTTLFDMEKIGGDSRWNTLRALRVLRSRQRAAG